MTEKRRDGTARVNKTIASGDTQQVQEAREHQPRTVEQSGLSNATPE